MPLQILIRIEFYNGIVRFLCHSDRSNAEIITHSTLTFTPVMQKHGDSTAHDQNHGKSHGDGEYM